MLRAWRQARPGLSRTPELDVRWTRICFCGQETEGGRVDDTPQVGLPFLTGSEEERGPLYDVTQQDFEGTRSPVATGPQGHKIYPPGASGVPNVVPIVAVRVGPGVLVTIPGEGTKEVGARIRADVERAVAGAGIERVVIAGIANEFILYFTTPEEYARQHYEGGNTHFGTYSSNLLKAGLAQLAGALVRGEPAPPAVAFDPTNGVDPNGPLYGNGAASGSITEQPGDVTRLEHARVAWQGGPEGLDRPVDRAFVVVQRRERGRWRRFDSDLGLAMLWEVDDEGLHRAKWEVPRSAPRGAYRFVVRAKQYRLVSDPFSVGASTALTVREVPAAAGQVAVALAYPAARRDIDLTHRPELASGGSVQFTVGGRPVRVTQRRGATFTVDAPAGTPVSVEPGQATDRFGNASSQALTLRP
jgi:hypothetical protein